MTALELSAASLETVIRAVPGVMKLFPVAPGKALLRQALQTVLGSAEPERVKLDRDDTGLTVCVTIGVTGVEGARDVCRGVYEAIADHVLASTGAPAGAIEVVVAQIDRP